MDSAASMGPEQGVRGCGCSGGARVEKMPSQRAWLKLAIAWVCAGQSMALSLAVNMTPPAYGTTLYWSLHGLLGATALGVLLMLGGALLRAQGRALMQRKITTEALFLLSIFGALGASFMGTFLGQGGIYYEVVVIVLSLYALGQRMQEHTRGKAQQEAQKLRADFNRACRVDDSGHVSWVSVEALRVGAVVRVKAGEPVPVDGLIVRGQAWVQESMLTGELEPVSRKEGQQLHAGSYLVDGILWVRAEGLKGQRLVDAILSSVDIASLAPSGLQAMGDRLVAYFVPLALSVSLGTFGFWFWKAGWTQALLNSMAVLLVACPCAFGLATPLTVWRSLILMAQKGLVAKTGRLLDVLASVTHVIWDKTGTLSQEALSLRHVDAYGAWMGRQGQLQALLLGLQQDHVHPIAQALRIAFEAQHPETLPALKTFRIHPGLGLEGVLNLEGEEAHVFAGDLDLMPPLAQKAFGPEALPMAKRRVYVSVNGQAAAVLIFEETLRPEALQTLKTLKAQGLELSILTGDAHPSWSHLAGVEVQPGCTPDSKRAYVAKLAQEPHNRLLFIGDGLNDLVAMSACGASLAMGNASALTQAQATGVLLSGRLDVLPEAVSLAQHAYRVVRGNLRFALLYNCVAMGLAAMGYIHPILAALLMLGSSAIVSFRSLRIRGTPCPKGKTCFSNKNIPQPDALASAGSRDVVPGGCKAKPCRG